MSKAITKNKNDKLKKIVLFGTGITATSIAAYFGWQYYKKSKGEKPKTTSSFSPPQEPIPEYKPITPTPQETNNTYVPPFQNNNSGGGNSNTGNGNSNTSSNTNTYSEPKPKSAFPIKKGSRGLKVKQLQQALMATHGASVLPRYGADGDFGSELVNALRKLNYPSVISESLYHVITAGYAKNNSTKNNSTLTPAKLFLEALSQHNYTSTINLLKTLQSKVDYSTVSTEFVNYRVNAGVRQTLVNACLNAFIDAKQKQAIRLEFLRMGLKFNGTKWSLDGIGNDQIITTRDTQIWLDGFTSMPVPCRMILGKAITSRLDYTMFEKNGKHFLVKTKDVQRVK